MAIPATDRATLVKGPATIEYKGVTLVTTDDFEVRPVIVLDKTASSFFGRLDDTVSTILWELSFAPLGVATLGMFQMLWAPVLNYRRGRSIFGMTDSDIVIHSIDGMQLTLAAGGISAVPDVTLAAVGSLFDRCTMQAVGAAGLGWDAAAKRHVLAAVAHAGHPLDRAQVLKLPYRCTWGAAPFDAFDTRAGMRISAQLSFLQDDISNNGGIEDRCLDEVTVSVRGEPVGVTAADVLSRMSLQGTGVRRGQPLSQLATTAALVIDGEAEGTPKFTVPACALEAGALRFGGVNRVGELTWRSAPGYAEGVFSAPVAIEINAAEGGGEGGEGGGEE